MSVHLGVLYHWSPRANRERILREGLTILNPCSDGLPWCAPWLCLATSPSSAWGLLPTRGDEDGEEIIFDLWQVQITDRDRIEIRSDFAPYIREVRVLDTIPADRVWWAGERGSYPEASA